MANPIKIECTIGDFSSKLLRYHRLPKTCSISFYSTGSNERKVRDDKIIHRKAINKTNIKRLGDDSTVSDMLKQAINSLFTQIELKRMEIRLLDPNGKIINGGTKLRTVKNNYFECDENENTKNSIHDDEWLWEVESIEKEAITQIKEAEYLRAGGDTIVYGYVKALISVHGQAFVETAINEIKNKNI